jgi:hypothetical protein
MPLVAPDGSDSPQHSGREDLLPIYVYQHIPLPRAQCFNLDPYGKDRMCDKYFFPDLLTDKGPSTG